MQALLRAGAGRRSGLERGLDHFHADGTNLLEPVLLVAAGGHGAGGHPGAEQGEGQVERGAGTAGLESEHLAVDLVLQGLAPQRAGEMRRRGASGGGHGRVFPWTSQEYVPMWAVVTS